MVANNSCCVVNARIKRQNEQKKKEGRRRFFYGFSSLRHAGGTHHVCSTTRSFDCTWLRLHLCVCFALRGVSIESVCVEQCVLCLRTCLAFELWQTLSNNCRVRSYNKKHEHTGSIGDKSPNMNARCYSISIRTQRQKDNYYLQTTINGVNRANLLAQPCIGGLLFIISFPGNSPALKQAIASHPHRNKPQVGMRDTK